MKYIIFVVLSVFLISCAEVQQTPYNQHILKMTRDEGFFYFYLDTETQCQYIVYSGSSKGGITPRLKRNGEPWCNQ